MVFLGTVIKRRFFSTTVFPRVASAPRSAQVTRYS
jgi:hypothetical protein